jgi:hypothetical protein
MITSTEYDYDDMLISRIVLRYMQLKHSKKLQHLGMDITLCHMNGCELRLDKLLMSNEYDFTHDVEGISKHINRDTGKLEHLFWPRFASY